MRMVLAAVLAAVSLPGAVGCGGAAADPLSSTTWRLLTIESMAPEESPSTVIDDPSKYTVDFGEDRRAAFQIDCNRGSSTFEVSPAPGDPDSGSLTFGPIAMTKMACLQPSADADVAAALGRVRSYLLADGRLHLSLEADSGIMHWEPVAAKG